MAARPVFLADDGSTDATAEIARDAGALVVRSERMIGKGGAATLASRAALEHARDAGVRNVDLTSRPSREAANRLYVRMGFEERETNVYRYSQP